MRPREIFRHSAFYGLGDLLKNACGFLLIPLYTRFLSPAHYGIVATLSVFTYLAITTFSVGQQDAALRFYFEYDDAAQKRKAISSIWWFLIATFSAGSFTLYYYGESFFGVFFPKIPFYPYGILSVGIIFFSGFGVICLSLLRAQERSISYSLLNFFGFLLNVLIIIYFVAVKKQGALGKLRADLFYYALIALVFVVVLRSMVGFEFSFSALKKTLAYGLPLVPHQIALWSLNLVDRICLGWFKDMGTVGLYSLGYNLALAVSFASSSLGMAWTPSFFKVAHQEESKAQFARFTTYYTLIVVSVTLVLSLFAQECVRIIATPKYYGASVVMAIAAWGYLFHAFYKVSVRVLSYAKKTLVIGASTIISALLNLGLNILLIPRYGMLGAAWATLVSFLFLAVVAFFFAQRFYPVRFERARLTKIFAAALCAYALAGAAFLFSPGPRAFFACKVFCFVLFAVIVYGTGFFNEHERRLIKNLLTFSWKK
jgi:O-antigen/teichoic acid export membrane protein